MKSRTLKDFAILLLKIAGLAALGVGLFFLNAFAGNPVSALLARGAVHSYLDREYAHLDVCVEKVGYSLKDTNYYAKIVSPTSPDTHFTVYLSMLGQVERDTYASVTDGFTTWDRLNTAYFESVKSVLQADDFPYTVHLANGDFRGGNHAWSDTFALSHEGLVVDGDYDLGELGAKHGHIVLYIEDEDISYARAAEVLMESRRRLDESGVSFYAMTFVLRHPKNTDRTRPTDSPELWLFEMPRAVVYADELEKQLREYHADNKVE